MNAAKIVNAKNDIIGIVKNPKRSIYTVEHDTPSLQGDMVSGMISKWSKL